MISDGPSRRQFLGTTGVALGGAWLFGSGPAVEAARAWGLERVGKGLPYETFTQAEGDDFEAFGARVIPTDDTPGAREAGCVHFADRALGSFMSDSLPVIRDGIERMNEIVAELYPGRSRLTELTEAEQDAVIARVETEPSPFFFFAKTIVLVGFVGNEEYGGNQNRIGWNHLGFESNFVYLPPFGFYDRDEHPAREERDAAVPAAHDHDGGGQ